MDIINVMERENMITSCLDGDFQCPYHHRYGFCDVHEALAGVQGKLADYLSTLNLYDIMFPHGGPAVLKGRIRRTICYKGAYYEKTTLIAVCVFALWTALALPAVPSSVQAAKGGGGARVSAPKSAAGPAPKM